MSLAIYAAPFDDNNNDKEDLISQKKISHNKTQKRVQKQNIDSKKVNSVLQSIHDNVSDDEDNLGDYYENPPPNPMSIGAQRASTKEGMQNNQTQQIDLGTLGAQPNMSNRTNNYELNNYVNNYGDEKSAEEYYKRFVPNFTAALMQNPQQQKKYSDTDIGAKPYMDFLQNQRSQQMKNIETSSSMQGLYNGVPNDSVLIEKLNYMINLLEEKKDERTNNVTEEVILYSFLGIFIIFVVDGFARVGKYTR